MTIAIIYAALSIAAFILYHRNPLKTRIVLALIAPILLAIGAVMWAVTRLEELG